MLRQVGRTLQKYLSFLFLPEQLDQLVLPDPQVAQDQLDPLAQQVLVAPPVQMVVMEAMVVRDQLDQPVLPALLAQQVQPPGSTHQLHLQDQ